VTKLGVGLKVPSKRSGHIADALVKATTSQVMIEKAARVGERIRSENGVNAALNAIHYNIGRAASDRTKMQWAKWAK
jgi:sterol 3beta-glucosyltransferase